MDNKNDYSKFKPKLTKAILQEVYSDFPDFLFFKTVKTGIRLCYCTACKKNFSCGTHVLQRLRTLEWDIADSARHGETVKCPVCGKEVKVINTKIQKTPLELSEPKAFFYGVNENDVWVCCYFINRKYSIDGTNCYDEQFETNVYHLKPSLAEHYKRPWSNCFGWYDALLYEPLYREPFQWDVGLMHRKYNYTMVYATKLKPSDTFLKYCGYDNYRQHYEKAPMIQYWCWYCNYPQLEMLSKLGRFETVDELVLRDKEMLSILNWRAAKPWELYKLSKSEYKVWDSISKLYRIPVLKLYKTIKSHDPTDFEYCRWIWNISAHRITSAKKTAKKYYSQRNDIKKILQHCDVLGVSTHYFKNTSEFILKILKYTRPIKEVFKYFERISYSSAGCCWHCPGITVGEVIDLWIDYVNMGDDGSKNFNPYPSNLKEAHDALLNGKTAKTAKQLRRDNKELIASLGRKYKKVNANCRAIAEKYSYDNGTYTFVVPRNIADILIDGWILNQCTARPDVSGNYWRYLDRVNKKEKYIGFVRKSETPDIPWVTIEFEPGGTVLQKRTEGDSQPEELMPTITNFLVEWQNAIASRLEDSDKSEAREAKKRRILEYDELRRTGKKINYGDLAGTLLIDAFEKDLMEIEIETA